MADRAINDLAEALQVNGNDLFVLEQSGIAKKLLGSALLQYISYATINSIESVSFDEQGRCTVTQMARQSHLRRLTARMAKMRRPSRISPSTLSITSSSRFPTAQATMLVIAEEQAEQERAICFLMTMTLAIRSRLQVASLLILTALTQER